jgi:hypothetical protein
MAWEWGEWSEWGGWVNGENEDKRGCRNSVYGGRKWEVMGIKGMNGKGMGMRRE